MLHTISRWRLLNHGERVVVGVSGGPDSTALLALLSDLAKEWSLSLTAAHLDHCINPELGALTWEQTQEFAARLGLEWVGKRENVLQHQAREGGSLHQVARRVRYQFFDSVASQVGANVVATGHSADDQAETVLMRIFKGSGALGASGIPPKREADGVTIIRPLIAHRRTALAVFCRERELEYVEDPANVELSFLRSRVRHEVIPLLEKAFGHDVVPHIASFSDRLREDQKVLDKQVSLLMKNPGVERTSSGFTFPGNLLENEPPGLLKLLVIRVLEAIGGKTPRLKADHLDAVADTARREGRDRKIILPSGWEVSVGSSMVRIGLSLPSTFPLDALILKCPGSTEVRNLGIRLHVRRCRVAPDPLPAERADEAYFSAEAVRGGLSVRNRRPGDIIFPLGAPGRRKLKKVMIERKIPKTMRDRVPIIITGAEGDEEILWVVGVALSESCRIGKDDKELWHLRVESLIDSPQA
jgi:tRNA(Ile)-lysidine synthase